MSISVNRRELLGAVGVSVTGLLAGCSGGGSDGTENQTADDSDASSDSRSRLAAAAARIGADEYDADEVVVRRFTPSELDGVRESMAYLGRLDRVIPLSLDVDVGSLADAVMTMEGTLVELTAPNDSSFESAVSGLDPENDRIGSFTLYAMADGLVAVDGRRLLLARSDEALSLSPRELLRRVIEEDSPEQTATGTADRRSAVDAALSAVETEHLRSLAVPLGNDTFGADTRLVPGGRAAAWGVTVDDSLTGTSVESTLAVQFPEGKATTTPVVDTLPENQEKQYNGGQSPAGPRIDTAILDTEFVYVDRRTAEVEEDTVTVTGSVGGSSHDGANPYLRPRGLDDAVLVEITAKQYEFRYSYPQYDVADRTELVLPTDRPVVFGLRSADVFHGFHSPALDLVYDIFPGAVRFAEPIELTESGEYPAYCNQYCGANHHEMTTRMVLTDSQTFRELLGTA